MALLPHSPEVHSESLRLQEAFLHCERLTRSHYENFPVGSLLVPGQKRRYVYAIYAFARTADDFADEGYDGDITIEQRLASLDDWGKELSACTTRTSDNPIFVALAATIKDLDIPVTLLEDLLSAFRQDVVKRRYADFAEVLDYCRRSANPIGRLILLVFGHRDESLAKRSDSICTALQLANFWQDISVDIEKDRIYLPADDMDRYGVREDDIRERRFSPAFASLVSEQVDRARDLFDHGRSLCEMVAGRLRYELRLTWLGGMRVLEKIERSGFDTLSARPVIGSKERMGLLAKALFQRL